MIVVCNASPLISLARIGRLELLRELFAHVHIAREVHEEVVVRGAGRPAAGAVGIATWIEVHPPAPTDKLAELRRLHPLGAGELATVLLGNALSAELVVLDERAARRLAQSRGLNVMGCVGLLETGCRRGLVTDLHSVYSQLISEGIRIDKPILNHSLASFGLPPV